MIDRPAGAPRHASDPARAPQTRLLQGPDREKASVPSRRLDRPKPRRTSTSPRTGTSPSQTRCRSRRIRCASGPARSASKDRAKTWPRRRLPPPPPPPPRTGELAGQRGRLELLWVVGAEESLLPLGFSPLSTRPRPPLIQSDRRPLRRRGRRGLPPAAACIGPVWTLPPVQTDGVTRPARMVIKLAVKLVVKVVVRERVGRRQRWRGAAAAIPTTGSRPGNLKTLTGQETGRQWSTGAMIRTRPGDSTTATGSGRRIRWRLAVRGARGWGANGRQSISQRAVAPLVTVSQLDQLDRRDQR